MGQTFVYNTGGQETKIDELHLNFGLFFDGTLNSKENTRIRKAVAENTAKDWEEKLYKKHGGKATDNVSFQNDYTNVARMQMECFEDYAIYIEGIGTVGIPDNMDNLSKKEQNLKIAGLGDVEAGYAMGAGVTGIRSKVRKGCELLAEQINQNYDNDVSTRKILKNITLDVFGFSRGAAAARNFIYEVNSTTKRLEDVTVAYHRKENEHINISFGNDMSVSQYEYVLCDRDKQEVSPQFLVNGKMPKYGYLGYLFLKNGILNINELNDLKIIIRFIGVYDTVSSYEEVSDMQIAVLIRGAEHLLKNQFQNDVQQLQLNNLGCFSKAVHFTAMDEHRENFDLTRMYITNPVSMPNSLEFNFPGVHCDVGGAYETRTENVSQIETSQYGSYNQLAKRIEQLLSEYWYKEDQLKVNDKWLQFFSAGIIPRKISGSRFVNKEYSYIPLHFMERFFREILSLQVNDVFAENLEIKYPILPIKRYVPKIEDFTFQSNWDIKKYEKRNINYVEDKTLIDAKDRLEKYVFEGYEEWRFISDAELERQKIEDDLQIKEYNKANGIEEEIVFDITKLNYNPLNWSVPKENQETKTESDEMENAVVLDELIIPSYNEQKLLRILRNKFLHWSATRAGFGMDPRNDYKRVEH